MLMLARFTRLAMTLCLLGAAGLVLAGVTFTARERALGTVLPGMDDNSLTASADARHFAYARKQGDIWRMVVDGTPGATYAGIGIPAVFSPDSRHVAYMVREGEQWHMLVDGKLGPAYDDIGLFTFSPNSQHTAYTARQGHTWCMVLDDTPGPAYTVGEVGITSIQNKQEKPVPVEEKHAFADIAWADYLLAFSPDSLHLAYAGPQGDKWFMMLDGKPGPPYDGILAGGGPVFSPDSRRMAFTAKIGDKWCAVVDGKPGPGYDMILPDQLTFSADNRRVAYAAVQGHEWRGGNHWFAVVDGIPSPAFDWIGDSLIFSPDSHHVAYAAQKSNKWYAFVDGKAGAAYAQIETLIFSPDSRHTAYVAQQGGKQRVVVDGKANPPYDMIADVLAYSPDSRHLAYAVEQGDKMRLLLDGKLDAAVYDRILLESLAFDSPTRLCALGIRANTVFRIELTLEASK